MLNYDFIPDNDYLLLTPGPLSTSKRVRAATLKDLCTWDEDYNEIVQDIRAKLLKLANLNEDYTTVLMQGSGTFSVESVLVSALSKGGKALIFANGEYGKRMAKIAQMAGLHYTLIQAPEKNIICEREILKILQEDKDITHLAFVHCETTTGILNPLEKVCKIAKDFNKTIILDAMSSFGGIEVDIRGLGIDFLISSANKCIQGIPGFGFIIAKRESLLKLKDNSRSLSLDLYDQWECMENHNGKWRFTSPTHTVRAFREALGELFEEGGIKMRHARYATLQKNLVENMERLGFECYIDKKFHSPIITTFLYLERFNFKSFYYFLKQRGFVIYPGKLSDAQTFRIGNIGNLTLEDIKKLISCIEEYVWCPRRDSNSRPQN